jgi:hypothetical protein
VHQVGYNKLIDIMVHGQRNIKIHNSKFHATLGEGGVQGSKMVVKMWKMLKKLNAQQLTGQMKMWRKCGNSIDKLLSEGMLAEELKCSGRNCEEDFTEDACTVHHVDALVHDTLVVKEVLAKKSINLTINHIFQFCPT